MLDLTRKETEKILYEKFLTVAILSFSKEWSVLHHSSGILLNKSKSADNFKALFLCVKSRRNFYKTTLLDSGSDNQEINKTTPLSGGGGKTETLATADLTRVTSVGGRKKRGGKHPFKRTVWPRQSRVNYRLRWE